MLLGVEVSGWRLESGWHFLSKESIGHYDADLLVLIGVHTVLKTPCRVSLGPE